MIAEPLAARISTLRRRCSRGHPMTGPNVYTNPAGKTSCRRCLKERDQRQRAELRKIRVSFGRKPHGG